MNRWPRPAGDVSQSTARLVEHTVKLAEPEEVGIKGADEPVPVRRLIGISPRDGPPGARRRAWSVGAGRWRPSTPWWTARPVAAVVW